jgi:lipid-binding SYLF domain-containing protein
MTVKRIYLVGLILVGLVFVFSSGAMALDKMEADLKIKEATVALKRFMTEEDSDAARSLLRKSKAVVLVPDLFKGGFIIGGKYGVGLVSVRNPDGSWSAPAFVIMGGANIGFQIGGEAMDLLLVVMRQRGLDGLLQNQFKFGVDASVAAGPMGRQTEASLTAASYKADVYSYSRAQGFYAGATVEGAAMEFDRETNKNYYGRELTSRQILLEKKVPHTPEAKELAAALAEFSK